MQPIEAKLQKIHSPPQYDKFSVKDMKLNQVWSSWFTFAMKSSTFESHFSSCGIATMAKFKVIDE